MPNDKIEEIKRGLEAATPGKWLCSPGDSIDEPAAVYIIEDDGINTFTVADNLLGVDANLIANATEWLRYLLQLVEQLRGELAEAMQVAKQAGDYAEQRNKWLGRAQRAVEERDDYRKVLEWYESREIIDKTDEGWDVGYLARDILSRYKRGDNTNGDVSQAPSDMG